MRPRSLMLTSLLVLAVLLFAGPGAAQQPAGPRAPAGFGSLRVKPETMTSSRAPAGVISSLATARDAGGRPSPWLLPVVGAATGGAVMAGYASYVCRDEECNLSPVPFVAAAVGLGALLGWMIDRSL